MQVLLWEQDKDGSHYSRVPFSEDLQLGLDTDPVQARRELVEQVQQFCVHSSLLFSLNCKGTPCIHMHAHVCISV